MAGQGSAPSRRWFSDIARLSDALAACPTMELAVRKAYAHAVGRADFSDEFERALAAQLLCPAAAQSLSAEVAACVVELEDLRPVTGFHIVDVPGTRAPCDMWLVWEHVDGGTTRVPANVKTESATKNKKNRGCALGPLLSWLTEEDGEIDKTRRGLDPDQMLVELLAGTRKLIPGRDYLLMIATPDVESTGRVTIRSLIARHQSIGTGLALERHQNRDVTVYLANPGPVIGPTCAIARELALALLPAGGSARVRAELIALVPERQRRQVATTLAMMTADELVRRLTEPASE